jgi:hypothetical protein
MSTFSEIRAATRKPAKPVEPVIINGRSVTHAVGWRTGTRLGIDSEAPRPSYQYATGEE